MEGGRCLFCGGARGEAGHLHVCDGRQGQNEAAAALGFNEPGHGPDHDGETYEADKDHVRLNAQTLRVWNVLRSGRWMTLHAISAETGDPEASVSARLRDLRKAKFGAHRVERQRVGDDSGLFVYRLDVHP